jgi:predicted transcriptional regulator
MPTLQQTIVTAFLPHLAEKKSLDEAKIESLRKLLADNRKVKADDFIKIFTGDDGDVA